jgi:hypothetical protein
MEEEGVEEGMLRQYLTKGSKMLGQGREVKLGRVSLFLCLDVK